MIRAFASRSGNGERSRFQIDTHLHPMWRGFQTAPRPLLCGERLRHYRLAHARNSAFMDSCQLIRKGDQNGSRSPQSQNNWSPAGIISEACLVSAGAASGIGPKIPESCCGACCLPPGRHRGLRGVVPGDVDQDLSGSSWCWLMCSVLSAAIDKCRRFCSMKGVSASP